MNRFEMILALCIGVLNLVYGFWLWRRGRAVRLPVDDGRVIVHESVIDGDALRITVRTRARRATFLVPREMVYAMSDDLLRAAAQLGKREQPQRGSE
jgi:hypothetical protein